MAGGRSGQIAAEIVVGDISDLQRRLVDELQQRARSAFDARGKFIVALPGGSVAMAFFPALATSPVDWSRTDFFWVDERAVPPDHPDSNYALASRLLLVPARAAPERVHRLRGELPDLEQAACQAEEELKSIAGDPPRLDVALLGTGADGHVASIFTYDRMFRAEPPGRYVLPVYNSPKPPARRLTLSIDVIASARVVVVAAFGESKAGAIRDALRLGDPTTPLGQVVRTAGARLVLLDGAAAKSLAGS